MTAAVVQYIRSCCILCFCAFGAPGSARTRGLSLWVFQEGGRADAQRKRDATRRPSHQASHRRLCRFPALYHPPFRGTKHLYRNTLFILVSIQRRGDTAQSRRRRCSIPAESVLNSGGFGALTERYIHSKLIRQHAQTPLTYPQLEIKLKATLPIVSISSFKHTFRWIL
jgi:hypothetical protein